jgi:DNA sulfur modification protein DndE
MIKKGLFFIAILGLFAFVKSDDRPTIFLIGDSTMANKNPIDAPETGWGMVFPEYFFDGVKIQNHAVNGRSTKNFRTLGHWKAVIDQLKSGDYVMIQFGHNDSKKDDSLRFAAPQTDYKQNLIRYINEIKSKGGNPILLTPVMRRKFDADGKFVDQHGEYPSVVRTLAKEMNIPLIDMHAKSQKTIEAEGVEGSKKMFMHYDGGIFLKHPKGIKDDTHFSRYGAELMASLAVEGLFDIGHPLRNFVKKSAFEEKYSHELPKVYCPVFKRDTFNITRYGAKADGIFLNTKAINQAIEMCSQSGGGVVLIPRGLWLTAGIVMKSNVNLHTEDGALIQFTKDYDQYNLVLSNWEGSDAWRVQPPIYGIDLENIAITGNGIFDGGGEAWRQLKKNKVIDSDWKKVVNSGGVLNEAKDTWYATERSLRASTMKRPGVVSEGFDSVKSLEIKEFLRPNLVVLTRCKNVLIENTTFQNSPAWTIHPLLCEHFILRGVRAKAPSYAQNADGIDVESCKNFIIENSIFDVGDDGITIKSGRDAEGRKRNAPTENGIIRNNIVYRAHGGFVIGSEMSGGARNLFVSNCTFMGTDIGLRFKTTRGRGGIVENIYATDITMTDILGEALLFDMYYNGKDFSEADKNPVIEAKSVSEETPQFRSFFIRNITCSGAQRGIVIRGLPEMNVKNINVDNSVFGAKSGMACIEGDGIKLKNIVFNTQNDVAVNISNSRNLTLDNVQFNGKNKTALNIEGNKTASIRLINSDISKLSEGVLFGKEVLPKVLNRN